MVYDVAFAAACLAALAWGAGAACPCEALHLQALAALLLAGVGLQGGALWLHGRLRGLRELPSSNGDPLLPEKASERHGHRHERRRHKAIDSMVNGLVEEAQVAPVNDARARPRRSRLPHSHRCAPRAPHARAHRTPPPQALADGALPSSPRAAAALEEARVYARRGAAHHRAEPPSAAERQLFAAHEQVGPFQAAAHVRAARPPCTARLGLRCPFAFARNSGCGRRRRAAAAAAPGCATLSSAAPGGSGRAPRAATASAAPTRTATR